MKPIYPLAFSLALAMALPAFSQEDGQNRLFRMQLPSSLIITGRDPVIPALPPLTTEQSISAAARKGVPFSVPLEAAGGVAPYHWSVPTPNSANATIGSSALVGTAQVNGKHDLAVLLADGVGTERRVALELTVTSPTVVVPLSTYAVDTATQISIAPTYGNLVDGPGQRTYSLSGAPGGVTVSSVGQITGYPVSAGTYATTVNVNDRDGSSGISTPFDIVVTGYPTADQNIDNRIASLSGGTLEGTTDRILATSIRGGTDQYSPATPKLQVVQGSTIQINYTEMISARAIYLGFSSPDRTCWEGRNSGSIGVGEYTMDFYVSRNGVDWVKNSSGMVRLKSDSPNCANMGGSIVLDADKTAFQHAKVTFTQLKRWNSTIALTLNVFRFRAHY